MLGVGSEGFYDSRLLEQPVNAIGGALRAGEHRVGLFVTYESLLDWIPGELAAQLHSDPAQDTGAAGTVRLFGCGDRRLASLDAGQPVEVVVVAPVEVDFVRPDLRVEDVRVA